jgi:uncharacterized protein
MKQRNSGGWLAEKSDAGDRIPLGRAVVLHLLPGTLTMGVLLTLTPFLIWAGQSRVLAYQVAVSLVGIPAMVGVMLWHARRTTGSASLATVIRFRKRPPVWMYAAVLVAFLGVRSVLRQCLAPGLPSQGSVRVAAGLPSTILEPPRPPDRTWLLAALVAQPLIDGIAAPVVEELYFRGFLLPRLAYLGAWAPLLNTFLFTVHHWWQPYNWAQIFLIMLPLVYLVWWRRSVWLSVVAHCAGNSIRRGHRPDRVLRRVTAL